MWVVHKSSLDVHAPSLVGVFTTRALAHAACVGVGMFDVFEVRVDRAYRCGELLCAESIIVTSLQASKL